MVYFNVISGDKNRYCLKIDEQHNQSFIINKYYTYNEYITSGSDKTVQRFSQYTLSHEKCSQVLRVNYVGHFFHLSLHC